MILILSHINADFDAFASMVAAKKLYPEAEMAFTGSPEPNVRDFLDIYGDRFELLKKKQIDLSEVSRLILVDISVADRLGPFAPLTESDIPIDIYNHHPPTPDDLPAQVVVHRKLGANTSILLELLIERGIQLSPFEATVMALGIYEDTGSLTYPSTTEDDLKLVAYLLSAGADLGIVSSHISRELTFDQVTLLSDLARSIEYHTINYVTIGLTSATISRYVGDLAVLTQKVRSINNLNVLFAVVQMEHRVYVVGRSRVNSVNVGRILTRMGGGGHPTAGSVSLRHLSLGQAKDRLLEILDEEVKPVIVAREIMSSPVDVIEPDCPIEAARQRILQSHHSCLPIVERRQIVGIVTKRDVAKAIQHHLGDAPVAQCMSSDVVTVGPETPYFEIQQRMIDHKIGHIPVVQDGLLVGIISRGDLLRSMAQTGYSPASERPSEEFEPAQMSALMAQRLPSKIKELFRQFGPLADEMSARRDTQTSEEEVKVYSVYAVGGLVRDLILNRPNWDVDIVVEGDGIAFAKRFVALHGGRVVSHKRFQTAVIIQPDGFKIDVATARIEHYDRPAALPVVQSSVIKHDLYRRDFTINSMAVQLNADQYGKLVDYFGGRRDLKIGVIRVLHNLSFIEDPTRIIRAVRFEQRYGFRIDQKTEHLLKQAVEAQMLDKVNGQRIRDELILLLKEEEPLRALMRLDALGGLSAIHSDLHIDEATQSVLKRVREVIAWFSLLYLDEPIERWVIVLLALVNPLKPRAKEKLQRALSLPQKARTAMEQLAAQGPRIEAFLGSPEDLKASDIYLACRPFSAEILLFIMARSAEDRIKRRISLYFDRLHRTEVEITGKDLIAMGVPQGALYKRILQQVLVAKLDNQVASREEELALAEELWEEHQGKVQEISEAGPA